MSQYMDISGIHLYSINGFPIVYINQRRGNNNHRSRSNVMHKCKICEWEIDAASSALFCSMECKVYGLWLIMSFFPFFFLTLLFVICKVNIVYCEFYSLGAFLGHNLMS